MPDRTDSRRGLLLSVLTAVVLAVSASSAYAVTGDSITGGAADDFTSDSLSFTFNASSGPSGENPTGTVGTYVRLMGTKFLGDSQVTCLNVQGNRGTVGFLFVGPSGPLNIFVYVQDLGGAGRDLRAISTSDGPPPTVCPIEAPFQLEPVAADIVVRDAQPQPTSKTQCKNGGFANFGFSNQGQCIKSVKAASKS